MPDRISDAYLARCAHALAPRLQSLLEALSEALGDGIEAAAILFEASMLPEAQWKPSLDLRSLRAEAIGRGWDGRAVDMVLVQLARQLLDNADTSFAKTRAARHAHPGPPPCQ